MKYYKTLGSDGSCCHGGTGKWPLPVEGKPGEWMPFIEGTLTPCKNGYHILTINQLLPWLNEAIFEVEVKGEIVSQSDKSVCREARLLRKLETWNEQTARLFACDCVERVLPIFEKCYPNDQRPRQAITITRLFAEGKATQEELDVAWVAAWDVARAAALVAAQDTVWSGAWAAAWKVARAAVQTAASSVAWAVVWNVARETALVAAQDVACDAEMAGLLSIRWQIERLKSYLQAD